MILEGLVTSLDTDGSLNVAPMGPIVDPPISTLRLRPFRSSRTYANLKARPYGVFHVTDDVLMLARAAIGRLDPSPETFPAEKIAGRVVASACRWYEFEVVSCDDSAERTEIEARVVHQGRLRDFFGFNRAMAAVLEAAILATRVHILPRNEILAEFARLKNPVEKTAGPREREAFALLLNYVESHPAPPSPQSPIPNPASCTITTGARLHCGLLAPGGGAGRRLGGVGLMVRPPGFVVRATVSECDEVVASEVWRARVAEIVSLCRNHALPDRRPPCCRIEIREALPAHAGFGSGTQLGLAVAQALAILAGETGVDVCELARRSGRGARSAVGLHGFVHGGLIVEGGKREPREISPLVACAHIPNGWRFVLARPRDACGLSGADEIESFSQLPPMSAGTTDRLCRLTLLDLLPAVAERRFDECAEALYEIGRTVGEHFAPAQGGVYAHPLMRELATYVRGLGFRGVGQTSWGPTMFVLCSDKTAATTLVAGISADPRFAECEFTVAAALNNGAIIQGSGSFFGGKASPCFWDQFAGKWT